MKVVLYSSPKTNESSACISTNRYVVLSEHTSTSVYKYLKFKANTQVIYLFYFFDMLACLLGGSSFFHAILTNRSTN